MKDVYENPLCSRYASEQMQHLFSPQWKFSTFRRLWLALAESEQELGLPITDEQLEEMRAHLDDIDFDRAAEYEHRLRHDVMAHIRTFGDVCPKAAGIIHLGATSCYVDDNTDLLQMRAALKLIRGELLAVIDALSEFAAREADTPALAWTHFQAAQPTTVGKRTTLWLQDFLLDLEQLETELSRLPISGCKGATGTAASFLRPLPRRREEGPRAREEDRGKDGRSQLHPRRRADVHAQQLDSFVMNVLSGIAQSAAKMATDVAPSRASARAWTSRLRPSRSAPPRWPTSAIPCAASAWCSLSRYAGNLASNTADTAMTQWLERTLDDSANRRLTLPEGFLACDAISTLCANVVRGCKVYPRVMEKHLREELPFLARPRTSSCAPYLLGEDRQTAARGHPAVFRARGGERQAPRRGRASARYAARGRTVPFHARKLWRSFWMSASSSGLRRSRRAPFSKLMFIPCWKRAAAISPGAFRCVSKKQGGYKNAYCCCRNQLGRRGKGPHGRSFLRRA